MERADAKTNNSSNGRDSRILGVRILQRSPKARRGYAKAQGGEQILIDTIIDITETFVDISKNMRIERCIQNVSK